jgi:hypothetical protein
MHDTVTQFICWRFIHERSRKGPSPSLSSLELSDK